LNHLIPPSKTSNLFEKPVGLRIENAFDRTKRPYTPTDDVEKALFIESRFDKRQKTQEQFNNYNIISINKISLIYLSYLKS